MLKNSSIILLSLIVLLLSGCRSSRTASDGVAITDIKQIESLASVSRELSGLSAKMKLSLTTGGKSVSSSGTIKVCRGVGVQLAVTPLGLFEAVRVEFLPEYIQYIDKLNSNYAQVDYSDLVGLGLDGSLLVSVFMNRIHIPDGLSAEDVLRSMTVSHDNGSMVLSTQIDGITYKYFIDEVSGLLVKSIGAAGGVAVECLYGDFQTVGNEQMPASVVLSLTGTGKDIELSFQFSRMKELSIFEATIPSASYKKVQASDILESLGVK